MTLCLAKCGPDPPPSSAHYRKVRMALLAQEIELRRHIESAAEQRLSLVVVARSPIEKLVAWKQEHGWRNLRLVTDLNDAYSRDYFGLAPDGSEIPSFNVFTRRDGTIRHFWSGEMTGSTADPGQDRRGAPDFPPMWAVLDSTPEGRGGDWYPKLTY